MTEDEAKTKWCPFVRYTDGRHELEDNRPWLPRESSPLCIASACMAWRKEFVLGDVVGGYCGLAGKP